MSATCGPHVPAFCMCRMCLPHVPVLQVFLQVFQTLARAVMNRVDSELLDLNQGA